MRPRSAVRFRPAQQFIDEIRATEPYPIRGVWLFLFNDNLLIMKQKLLNALKEGYKNLGLAESAFERVAAFGETFITSDEQIESFVKTAEAILKAEQSAADKVRTELNAKIKGLEGAKADLEAKLNGNNPPDKGSDKGTPDIATIVAQAVAAAINPLQDKLNAFETAKTAELAVKQAQEKFGADEWVNGYPELRDSAWAQAMRIYDRTGKSMTADELHAEAMEIFKPLAKAKGLDISKPFQSDGGAGAKPDFSADVELLKNEGVDFGE